MLLKLRAYRRTRDRARLRGEERAVSHGQAVSIGMVFITEAAERSGRRKKDGGEDKEAARKNTGCRIL